MNVTDTRSAMIVATVEATPDTPTRMRLGCGVRTMTGKNHEYLYFGQYETQGGGRRAVHDYVGPAKDPDSGRKGVEALEAYARKAIDEARRRLQSEKVQAMAGSR